MDKAMPIKFTASGGAGQVLVFNIHYIHYNTKYIHRLIWVCMCGTVGNESDQRESICVCVS